MVQKSTRVSVITLTWNHLEYTKKAIESIATILTPHDELIIIDNHSTDGTLDYISHLSLQCPVVSIMNLEQQSIAKSYNLALRQGNGKYFFLFDNDMEIVMSNTLDHLIQTAEQADDIGIVTPYCNNIVGRSRCCASKEKLPYTITEIKTKRKRNYPMCPSAGWLITRNCIEKVGYFDERFTEYGILDFDYAKIVLNSGLKILADGFVFIQHYGSITAKEYVNSDMLRRMGMVFSEKWGLKKGVPKGMIRR